MGEDNPFSPFTINFLTTRGIFDDMSNRVIPTVRCNESADVSSNTTQPPPRPRSFPFPAFLSVPTP